MALFSATPARHRLSQNKEDLYSWIYSLLSLPLSALSPRLPHFSRGLLLPLLVALPPSSTLSRSSFPLWRDGEFQNPNMVMSLPSVSTHLSTSCQVLHDSTHFFFPPASSMSPRHPQLVLLYSCAAHSSFSTSSRVLSSPNSGHTVPAWCLFSFQLSTKKSLTPGSLPRSPGFDVLPLQSHSTLHLTIITKHLWHSILIICQGGGHWTWHFTSLQHLAWYLAQSRYLVYA